MGILYRTEGANTRRSKLYIACSDFFSKVGAHSFRCYSFPNRTCCAGLRFGFSCEPESSCLESVHAFHASARQSPGFFIGRQGLRRISAGSAIHARIALDIAASLCCPVVSGRSILVLDVSLRPDVACGVCVTARLCDGFAKP